jgi:hypothetical protein
MMRRLTIACGVLTAGVAFAVAVQGGQSLIQSPTRTTPSVTVIPDRQPAPVKTTWPPVQLKPPTPPPPSLKGLPPRPRPWPMHRTTTSAAPASPSRPATALGRTVGRAVGVVRTLLSIPKLIGQSLVNAGR